MPDKQLCRMFFCILKRLQGSWRSNDLAEIKQRFQVVFFTWPQDVTATYWKPLEDSWSDEIIRIRFSSKACRQCKARPLCTRQSTETRFLTLRPQAHHKALVRSRKEQETEEWKERYAKRAGVEGTIFQGVRGFGLRQCRYIGLAKTHLQHILTVVAINLARVDAWFTGKKGAHTRVSHFAALRPASA